MESEKQQVREKSNQNDNGNQTSNCKKVEIKENLWKEEKAGRSDDNDQSLECNYKLVLKGQNESVQKTKKTFQELHLYRQQLRNQKNKNTYSLHRGYKEREWRPLSCVVTRRGIERERERKGARRRNGSEEEISKCTCALKAKVSERDKPEEIQKSRILFFLFLIFFKRDLFWMNDRELVQTSKTTRNSKLRNKRRASTNREKNKDQPKICSFSLLFPLSLISRED